MPVNELVSMESVLTRRILANTFANHLNDSVCETFAQLRQITRICTLFEEYNGEQTWNFTGDTLKGMCYLSRDDHDRNIKARKQSKHIGEYSLVNRTIKLWSQLLAEALASFPCKSHSFGKGVRKITVREEK